MKIKLVAFLTFLLTAVSVRSQELLELHRYDALNSDLEGHVTQILQDKKGLVWLSTWNGLYRFDGYEFSRIKPLAGNGCSMTSDRIRDFWEGTDGSFFCRTDDGIFRFDTKEYQFHDVTSQAELAEAEEARDKNTTRGRKLDKTLEYIDPHGLYWRVEHDVLYCLMRTDSPITPLPMEKSAMTGCLYQDRGGGIWVTTKSDATVRLLNNDGTPRGYLTPDGRVTQAYTSFGHPIYSICQTRDGRIWLGSKPDGLFRLTMAASGNFTVEHMDILKKGNVYDMAEDYRGRLWVAMLGSGIACVDNPSAPSPTITDSLPGYPYDKCPRMRRLHITPDGIMLCTTTDGLLVARIEDNLGNMHFRRHSRDTHRSGSLFCNATMDIVQTASGRIFVSTETDGISEITSKDLLADSLTFKRYNTDSNLLPTDMIVGMALARGERLLVVGDRQLVNLNIHDGSFETLGHLFFRHPYQFSESQVLMLDDGRWLIGTTENAIFLSEAMAHSSSYNPPLLLTGITKQNQPKMLAVEHLDSLVLQPDERNVTIHFAALDYTDPASIRYQFRLDADSSGWSNIGTNHSVTLLDLRPGTYHLSLRSTNAEGLWTDNVRTLTIVVVPTFWETTLAKVLLVLLVLALIAASVYTYFYVKRIKRHQQEALKNYLDLLAKGRQQAAESQQPSADANAKETKQLTEKAQLDPFMQQVLDFTEKNLANSDADVNLMAEACHVSRSVLQRKLKQMVGLTPLDFMREARIKKACSMLGEGNYIVSEVAYRCGFSDPKYFSRCFKKSVGMTPTEYRSQPKAPATP